MVKTHGRQIEKHELIGISEETDCHLEKKKAGNDKEGIIFKIYLEFFKIMKTKNKCILSKMKNTCHSKSEKHWKQKEIL